MPPAVPPPPQGAGPDPLIGATLGGYEIKELIGAGAMGRVYRARQLSLDREVAVKVLPSQFAADEIAVARFRREAKAAAAVQNNHLVHINDYGEEEGVYYYVMELIRGDSLGDLLERHTKFEENEVIQIGHQTLLGLEAAHEAGIVHRDVKPDNLMLTRGGRIKVADLGLARTFHGAEDTTLTQSGVAMGAPHYVSPEQLREGGEVDHRSDFYAFGATLYHLATGQPPFPGRSVPEVTSCHLHDPPPNASEVNPALTSGFTGLLRRLMAKDPAERPATHKELYDALERCQKADEGEGEGEVPMGVLLPDDDKGRAGKAALKQKSPHGSTPPFGRRRAQRSQDGRPVKMTHRSGES